jgi:CRP/FNR family cyclic AMP-dependent transcriptional regulator
MGEITMISPEVLRKYPFFAEFDNEQLKSIARITERVKFISGTTIYSDQDAANKIYFLLEGSGDIFYCVGDTPTGKQKIVSVGEINPGELFGFAALYDPYQYTSTVKIAKDCETLVIPTEKLNELFKLDKNFGYIFYRHIAKYILERLNLTRIQLAAAWA